MPTEADYRLPRDVVPSHYELTLEPDLEAATFSGSMLVEVEVLRSVDQVVLNAAELEIDRAELVGAAGEVIAATTSYDADTERATLVLDSPAGPGVWQLRATFRGMLNDQLRGFYRSVYRDEDGATHTIATTQFEATDARRAFPCWDEPDLKASFEVTLVIEEGLMAISNGPEVARTALSSGKTAVRFGRTIRMSTYLVAFIVGDLVATEPVDVDGVPLRVIAPPGKTHLADFALEMGAFALRYYTNYYGIPYPEAKLDMIAIPDFAWGAMENIGAITYRETALLLDRESATQSELTRVADVVAHEIAHMWFGDLVTMQWWNGTWLNEAFATFAEIKCVDAFRPEWKRWLSFAASRSVAMETDATSETRPIEITVVSPEDASAMFDSLTYLKGSAVLRMLEQFLGEGVFRSGVSAYLGRHAFGNTETADLWAALEEVSGQPVGEIMHDWIFQGGFPEVVVEGRPGDYRITQKQFRYLTSGDGAWRVPLLFRAGGEHAATLLEAAPQGLATTGPLVANAGGDGFYRVRYSGTPFTDIAGALPDLAPAERYSFVSDVWAGVLAGTSPAAEFLGLIDTLRGEREPTVWSLMVSGIGELDRIVESSDRERLQRFTRDLVGPAAAALGWEPDPGEDDQLRRLRGLLIRAMGILGADSATRERAGAVREEIATGSDAIDAEVGDAALAVVAADGTMGDFEAFMNASRSSANPQDVVRYLRAASAVPEDEAAARLFDLVLDGTIRSQDSFWVLALMLGRRETGATVWGLMRDRWDAMLSVVPPTNGRHIIDYVPYRSEPDVAADIEAWLADHAIRGGERYAKQQLELLRVRVGLRRREAARLGAALG